METSQFSLQGRPAQGLRVGNVTVPLRAAAVNFHGPDSPAHAAGRGVRRSAAARRDARLPLPGYRLLHSRPPTPFCFQDGLRVVS